MEKIYPILTRAVELGATDIHLTPGQVPVYRVCLLYTSPSPRDCS